MNPYMQAAGMGLEAYGSYEKNKQAEKQYEAAVQAWQAEMERQRVNDEQDRQQQMFTNALAGGNYSQGLVKNAQDSYGSYARQVGY